MRDEVFHKQLEEGEYILWKGTPAKGNLYCEADLVPSAFGAIWTGALVYITITRMGLDGIILNLPITLIPIFMFFAGLYITFIRFIVESYRRNKIIYIITNKRLMIGYGNKVISYFKNQIDTNNIYFYPNGNALIIINLDSSIPFNNVRGDGYVAGISEYSSALVNIEDVNHVLSLINQMEDIKDL